MLVGYSFTENITVDAAVGILETSKPIYTTVSLGKFIDQLLLKVISLQETRKGRLIQRE